MIDTTNFKQYTVGTKAFFDGRFGGKPEGKVIEIVTSGNGMSYGGEIKLKLSETVGAYKKGEVITSEAFQIVPCKQIKPLQKGQFYLRLDTRYIWVK